MRTAKQLVAVIMAWVTGYVPSALICADVAEQIQLPMLGKEGA